jgi:hypothetical protein
MNVSQLTSNSEAITGEIHSSLRFAARKPAAQGKETFSVSVPRTYAQRTRNVLGYVSFVPIGTGAFREN